MDELRYVNDQFKYGFTDEQLVDIIHAVGGYNADTITFEKFSRYIEKKVARRKVGIWWSIVAIYHQFNYTYKCEFILVKFWDLLIKFMIC